LFHCLFPNKFNGSIFDSAADEMNPDIEEGVSHQISQEPLTLLQILPNKHSSFAFVCIFFGQFAE